MSDQPTLVDRIMTRFKNNRIVAIVMVIGFALVATARISDATKDVISDIQQLFVVEVDPTILSLRRTPKVLVKGELNAMVVKYGFYDNRLNSVGKGIIHQYEQQVKGNTVVVFDAATGLMWQKDGAPREMTVVMTENYITKVNQQQLAGFNDWRLPTVEEALSLMEAEAVNNFHINPIFNQYKSFIWTADKTKSGKGILIYFYDGEVGTESFSFNAWVRLVRSN